MACEVGKKRLQHKCFPVNIVKFLRTLIWKNICEESYSKERQGAAASVLTLVLNADNLLTGYEQITSYIKSSIKIYQVVFYKQKQ